MLVISKSKRLLSAAMTLAMLAPSMPLATAATINVGNCFLAPNRAEQTVRIFVSGGGLVYGLNFFAQIGHGDLSDIDAPVITAVDIKTGTIFDLIPDAQTSEYISNQVVYCTIECATNGEPVAAQGLLATLTMDASGFFEGSWDFWLAGVLDGVMDGPYDTDFAGTAIDIQNGTIGITIDGDCTLDGRVDEADATVLAANWQASGSGGQQGGGIGWTEGDFNADGIVDNADTAIIVQNWLQSAPVSSAASAVPEPATAALFTAFLLVWTAALRLRRRHSFAVPISIIVFAFAASVSFTCHASDKAPVLKIPRLQTTVKIDGNLDESCYAKHGPFTDFRIAADSKNKPPLTRAWVFWQKDKLIFAYECEDKLVVAQPPGKDEMAVDLQDRVELFLWNGRAEDAYLCLELAPRGAVLDYRAGFYRRFETDWDAQGLKTASVITANGYRVEAELPAAAARPFGIEFDEGATFRAGLFRGNYQTGKKDEEPMWITWVESGTDKPDFHVAAAFGRFVLVP